MSNYQAFNLLVVLIFEAGTLDRVPFDMPMIAPSVIAYPVIITVLYPPHLPRGF